MNTNGAAAAHVVQIREMRADGHTLAAIASRFGITKGSVSQIARGLTYPEMGGPIVGKDYYARGQGSHMTPQEKRAESVKALALFEELLDSPGGTPDIRDHWQQQADAERMTIATIDVEVAARGLGL